MFYQTAVLHVTENGGEMYFDRRKRDVDPGTTGWHIELNGEHHVLSVEEMKRMTEEEFLDFLSMRFNIDTTNLPRLEMGGKRKSPPRFYEIRKRGRPPKNAVRGSVQVVVVKRGKNATRKLEENTTEIAPTDIPGDVNILT